MDAYLIYLLKMLACSGILYAYFRLALYNERFHHWNRFYIITAVFLSIVVPLISLPITPSENNSVMNAISTLPWNTIKANESILSPFQIIALCVFVLTSLMFIIKLGISISRIVMLYKKGTSKFQHDLRLIITTVKDAPFSFFNWLFWRADIDPASTNGSRILQHELAHIRQRHSVDKLFMSLVLCICWINPFFWLFKKELYLIHEFLADREAVDAKDGAAFAHMILQAIPITNQTNNTLINPFISSNIKRRLQMITSSKLAKYSYARRISGLAIMIISIFFIALSVQNTQAQAMNKKVMKQTADTTVVKKKRTEAGKEVSIEKTTTVTKEGKKEIRIEKTIHAEDKETGSHMEDDLFTGDLTKAPLYIVDGIEKDAASMKGFDQNTIATVDVLKGQKAIDTYGDKAKNGVVKISTNKSGNNNERKEITRDNKAGQALIYVDGKPFTHEEMNLIKPNDIESVNVLKGESAIKKYGNKAVDGVIEIKMKKPAL